MHERRENAKCARYEMRERCENAKCARDVRMRNARETQEREMRERRKNAKCARYAKHEVRENAKIAKVAALQQVQYKVLLYGLYVPVETCVSTA